MSHAYPDGCSIYFTFVGASPDDRTALETYTRTWSRALEAAHRAGGTIAHHHGIGRSKRQAMRLEHGAGLSVLASLARAADPHGVLAGGPLLPAEGEGPPSPALAPPKSELSIDTMSQLVTVRPSMALAAVRAALAPHNLELPWAPLEGTVLEWLAQSPAAEVLSDPVDHRVAGYVARTREGRLAHLLPAPRRAAGPELWTLFATQPDRWGTLESVTLVARRKDRRPVYTAPFERSPLRTSPNVQRWIERASE